MPDLPTRQRFVLDLEPGGVMGVYQLTNGDFSSATLTELMSVTRDISAVSNFVAYLIERNMS